MKTDSTGPEMTTFEAAHEAILRAARLLDAEAEELEADGGPGVFNQKEKSIAAQTLRNAASKVRAMPVAPRS
ncbi:hypothetical protein [Actinomadura viridis]|uniref:Uncharacterized protein n=1 Tax=Actinomadura viridis TaxID=58110 RepID=A0A931GJL5_9ACTN|nr:hypothetical protein [Actinomadura viridis]MBG6089868.1 hypothetical protein [Actinomadura viridis]